MSDLPEWLRGVTQASGDSSEPGAPLPDWLAAQAGKPEGSLQASSALPDWLQKVTGPAGPAPTGTPPKSTGAPPPSLAADTEDDLPDWLAPADTGIPPVFGSSSAEAEGDDLPDWLAASSAPAPGAPPEPVTPEQGETELPDWLASSSLPEAPVDQGRAEEAQDEAIPDWLASTPVESSAAVEDEAEDIPDWLAAAPEMASLSEPSGAVSEEKEESLPDWLSSDSEPVVVQTEPAADSPDEAIPDWLSGEPLAETPESVPPADTPPAAEDVPDWFASIEEGATESVPAPAGGDLPDWLEESDDSPTTPVSADVPDWLIDAAEQDVPALPETPMPGGSAGESAVPDWLLDAAQEAPPETGAASATRAPQAVNMDDLFGEPAAPEAPPSAPIPEAQGDVPDWLLDAASEGEAVSPPPAVLEGPAAGDAAIPDWLNEAADAAPAPETAGSGDNLPDWMMEEAAETAPTTPAASDDIPDWMMEEAESPSVPLSSTAPAAGLSDSPDWLAEFDPQAAPPRQEMTPQEAASEPAAIDIDDLLAQPADSAAAMDWLGDLGLDLPTAPEVGEEDDLFGLSGGFLPSEEEAGPAPEEIAAILAEIEDEPGEQLTDLSLADQIRDLRFDSILGGSQGDAPKETIGALSDLSGVFKAEVIFEGTTLHVEKVADQIVVTDEQARQIARLDALFAGEEAEAAEAKRRRLSVPVVRWLVAVLLLAGAAFPAFSRTLILPPPGVSTGTRTAFETLDSLPPDAQVVLALEYEPDYGAELDPITEALLSHLAQREDIRLYAMTTRPFGTSVIERSFAAFPDRIRTGAEPLPEEAEETEETTEDAPEEEADAETEPVEEAALPELSPGWYDLGYVPASAVGIRGVVIGMPTGVPSPLVTDFNGSPLEAAPPSLTAMQPDLLIVLSARPEEARYWIEQSEGALEMPIIAGVTAGAGPLMTPYASSVQITALMVGLNDGMAYHRLLNSPPSEISEAAWNGQAVSSVAAAVMMIVGALVFWLQARRRAQE